MPVNQQLMRGVWLVDLIELGLTELKGLSSWVESEQELLKARTPINRQLMQGAWLRDLKERRDLFLFEGYLEMVLVRDRVSLVEKEIISSDLLPGWDQLAPRLALQMPQELEDLEPEDLVKPTKTGPLVREPLARAVALSLDDQHVASDVETAPFPGVRKRSR